jgi:hypothetical protein
MITDVLIDLFSPALVTSDSRGFEDVCTGGVTYHGDGSAVLNDLAGCAKTGRGSYGLFDRFPGEPGVAKEAAY